MTVLKIDELNWESDSDCLDHKNFKFPGDFFVKSQISQKILFWSSYYT